MWRRWTCWLAAVLLISGCSHGTLTRVVRTDGTSVVGELTAARPDAVVVKLSDGTLVTIPRSVISAIESAQAPTTVATNTHGSGTASGSNTGSTANTGNAGKSAGPGTSNGSGGINSGGSASGGSASGGSSGAGSGSTGGSGGGATSGGGSPAIGGGGSGGAANARGGAAGGNASSGNATGNASRGNASSGSASSGNASSGGNASGGVGGGNASDGSGAATRVAREAVAPSGTLIELTLNTPIGSDTSTVDDKIDAVLHTPLIVNGQEILGAGTRAHGTVTEATPSARADGRGRLAVRFDGLDLGSRTLPIQAALHWEAPGIVRRPVPEQRGGSFFRRMVDKTKKGLRIADDAANGPRGAAEVRFASGAVLRIRLEQPARLAP